MFSSSMSRDSGGSGSFKAFTNPCYSEAQQQLHGVTVRFVCIYAVCLAAWVLDFCCRCTIVALSWAPLPMFCTNDRYALETAAATAVAVAVAATNRTLQCGIALGVEC